MGYINPKSVADQFLCIQCNIAISKYLANTDYMAYLRQLSVLRRLIRFVWLSQESTVLLLQDLSTSIMCTMEELKSVVFYLQDMDFGKFTINGVYTSCFRQEDMTPEMGFQVPRSRKTTDVVRKIFNENVMHYTYYSAYKDLHLLYKSFNRYEGMTMSTMM